MPQLKSSAKRLRQSQKAALRNKQVKDNIDYLFRQLKKALAAKDKPKAEEFMKKLVKSMDKAAKRNVYKANKSARRKSRMMKKLNQLKSNT
jgi:small subunit ribosomal protein S20